MRQPLSQRLRDLLRFGVGENRGRRGPWPISGDTGALGPLPVQHCAFRLERSVAACASVWLRHESMTCRPRPRGPLGARFGSEVLTRTDQAFGPHPEATYGPGRGGHPITPFPPTMVRNLSASLLM